MSQLQLEAFNPMGSVKDRLALGLIERAEAEGKLAPGQTVVEPRPAIRALSLAMVCAAKGYPFVCTMAESFSIERRKLKRFLLNFTERETSKMQETERHPFLFYNTALNHSHQSFHPLHSSSGQPHSHPLLLLRTESTSSGVRIRMLCLRSLPNVAIQQTS
jgi:hypothetical protein